MQPALLVLRYPFASWQPEGEYLSITEIMDRLPEFNARHVVLTGGEPMIFQSVVPLAQQIVASGYHLTIETAGTVWHPLPCHLWSISPKLTSSAPPASSGSWLAAHHRRRYCPQVVRRMMQQTYQLKFVVDGPTDADEVLEYLRELGDFDGRRVLLMPQGVDAAALDRQAEWLEPWCRQHDLQFCPQRISSGSEIAAAPGDEFQPTVDRCAARPPPIDPNPVVDRLNLWATMGGTLGICCRNATWIEGRDSGRRGIGRKGQAVATAAIMDRPVWPVADHG